MLTDERYSYILQQLKVNGVVKSQDLMEELNCSESTIRRDLDQLEKAGSLKRIHGGAKRIYQLDEEISNKEKTSKNVQEKDAIGKLAASLIEANDVIFLDAGTTTMAMIESIHAKNITVVTNGVWHASMLADKDIPTIQIGGKLKNATKAIVGATGLQELQNYRFTKAFLGINGLDIAFGCTTPDPEEAAIKRLAHEHAAITYCLADHTKWNKVNFVKVCDIGETTIITNGHPNQRKAYEEKTTILEAKQ
ncbi:DeoR/GlpR family DNA-binding transcription regulator [Virgibacillus ainsalahensis]